MRFVQTKDGSRLFYQDWGTGEPVVFVHGFTLSSEIWEPQMQRLAEAGYRCVAYDRRGHGRSERAWTGYDFDTLADDLGSVLETLDLNGVTLVGHSIGAGEIVRYLSRHGSERVARVVSVSGAIPGEPYDPNAPDQVRAEQVAHAIAEMERDRPGYYATMAPALLGHATQDERHRWLMHIALRTSLPAALGCTRAQASDDFAVDLAAVSMPMLLVHGDADHSNPMALTSARVAEAVPTSRLVVYEGAPHGLFVTHGERLSADLLTFLGE
jgi:non-heme chloroperoxidase